LDINPEKGTWKKRAQKKKKTFLMKGMSPLELPKKTATKFPLNPGGSNEGVKKIIRTGVGWRKKNKPGGGLESILFPQRRDNRHKKRC